MTTIDTCRLRWDAAYWSEAGAPDDATHYAPATEAYASWWMWYKDGAWFAKREGEGDTWRSDVSGDDPERYIPRPPNEVPEDAEHFAWLPGQAIGFWRRDGKGVWQVWAPVSGQWCYDAYANDAGAPPFDLQCVVSPEQRLLCALAQAVREDLDTLRIGLTPKEADAVAISLLNRGWTKP